MISCKLNFLKKTYVLFILLIVSCSSLFIISYKSNQFKKLEEDELINRSDKIENCIDIENKNKRSIYENIKLSEYCINNFGIIKLSQ